MGLSSQVLHSAGSGRHHASFRGRRRQRTAFVRATPQVTIHSKSEAEPSWYRHTAWLTAADPFSLHLLPSCRTTPRPKAEDLESLCHFLTVTAAQGAMATTPSGSSRRKSVPFFSPACMMTARRRATATV